MITGHTMKEKVTRDEVGPCVCALWVADGITGLPKWSENHFTI
jgi:hypothetical protein